MIVYILAKDGKIKCVEIEFEAQKLESEGWVHTDTFDPCFFIAHLHNDAKNAINEVRNLSKKYQDRE
jgi:hypothetical protein